MSYVEFEEGNIIISLCEDKDHVRITNTKNKQILDLSSEELDDLFSCLLSSAQEELSE